jgi:hypothetical protein
MSSMSDKKYVQDLIFGKKFAVITIVWFYKNEHLDLGPKIFLNTVVITINGSAQTPPTKSNPLWPVADYRNTRVGIKCRLDQEWCKCPIGDSKPLVSCSRRARFIMSGPLEDCLDLKTCARLLVVSPWLANACQAQLGFTFWCRTVGSGSNHNSSHNHIV